MSGMRMKKIASSTMNFLFQSTKVAAATFLTFNYIGGFVIKPGLLEEMTPHLAPSGDDWSTLSGGEYVEVLTDATIGSFIKSQDSVLVMFYAPWCGHCKSAKPEYAKAAQLLKKEAPGNVLAAVDCMRYPSVYEKYEIIGYPTFQYYRSGRLIGEYHHRRRASDFVHFMLRKPSSKDDL